MRRSMKKIAWSALIAVVIAALPIAIASCHRSENRVQKAGQEKLIYHCPMHPNYFSEKPGDCPICGMKLVPVADQGGTASAPPGNAATTGGGVRIDPATVQNIGVTTEVAVSRNLTKEIRASANISLDETSVAIVSSKVMGWVEKLYVDYTGQSVYKGQPLLTIYSPDLVSTEEEYLQSLRYLGTLSATTSLEARKGAEELVASTRRRLINWDISESEIEALGKRGTPQKTLTLYAPSGGVALEKAVVAGQSIQPGAVLYRIADIGTIWAIASIFQDDLPSVKVGMTAKIEVPSIRDTSFTGKVAFIAPLLDEGTKTAAVRIAVRNTRGVTLKPGMFANAVIESPLGGNGVSVSRQSVLPTGKRDLVVLALGNGYFKPVEVKLGASAGNFVQVLEGIKEGDTVVSSAQFLIDAESDMREAVKRMSAGGAAAMKAGAAVSPSSTVQKAIYTCPMDPEIVSDKPGKCPKCGMDLVKK
jgi:membrane fusion protein, copper/silver efflux system